VADLKRLSSGDFGLTDEQRDAIEAMVERNERSSRFAAQERAAKTAREEDELADLESMTNKALSGVYGGASKKAAERWQGEVKGEPNAWHMQQLRQILQRIPGRQSG
jgi:hypothetical protein